jgi:branched-chain amino acid transport system substrate-binding protein
VNPIDANCVYGMGVAFTMVDTLKMAGKSLTRDGVMHAANNLNELDNPFVYPGVKVTTTPTDRFPIREEVLIKYTATGAWKPISALITNRY